MRAGDLARLLELRPRSLEGRAARLASCYTIEDLRQLARRRVPGAMFDFIEGAADDEIAAQRNLDAFAGVVLTPRQMRGNGEVDLRTELLGSSSDLPLAIAPTGLNGLLYPDGEVEIARAAAAAGIPYVAPAMGSSTLEAIAAASSGPRWFQIYLWRDRALMQELMSRARTAGYSALVITVDTRVAGSRPRDLANGLTIPPRLAWAGVVDAIRHPSWTLGFLGAEMPDFANVEARADGQSTVEYVGSQFDAGANWDRVAEIIAEWGGPAIVKGVLTPADARHAAESGAAAVLVSNHGGRQFSRCPATLDVLPAIVEELRGEVEVYLDSGIRQGTDIVAALALGASACLIGRAPLFGLAAGGRAGVARALEILRDDLRRSLVLLGVSDLKEVSGELIGETPAGQARGRGSGETHAA
jgi:L-lactate dehydrogenase (cytochrome)